MRFISLCTAIFLYSCTTNAPELGSGKAQAIIRDRQGDYLGTITFSNNQENVKVMGELEGLTPSTKMGFHIHERGVCHGDFSSAGSHFNPTDLPHGSPGVASHVGDLGNIETNNKGKAHYEYFSEQITLTPQGNKSVIGKTVIIHAGQDDFVSQPSGDSGIRVGCGIIQRI